MAIFNLNDPEPGPPGQGKPEAANKSAGSGLRSRFKAALAIVVMVGGLAGWNFYVDHSKGLDPGIFRGIIEDTFELRWPQPPVPVVPKASTVQSKGNEKLPEISPVFVDDANNLDSFYAALWGLEQAKQEQAKPDQAKQEQVSRQQAQPSQAKAGVVITILHYGDSPTTADMITGDVRARLQERFGDAGRGYTLIAKPWAWYGHRGVDMSDHGWKIRTSIGLMREGIYGLGGAAFEGEPGAWSKFRLTESPQSSVEVEYLAKSGGGVFAVEADDQQILEQSTNSETQAAASVHVALPIGTKLVSIRPTSGSVTLFGADFRRGNTGLLYDSLGLNGATTSVIARVLQPALWQQELDHAAPALVIINYGSNESSFGNFVHKQYANELRLAIQRVRDHTPAASILIMSPMDRGERSGLDDIKTMDTIPEIVAIQRQVAAETHVAFFDTFNAMGGDGAMARWYAAHPRLVTADLLHPTPQGATIVAGLFVDQLDLGYNRWKMQHGIALSAASPVTIPKADTSKGPATAKLKAKSSPAPHDTGEKATEK
jgi:lysophospholipase L1-like esterase